MCFGHEEILQNFRRRCRVTALSTCLLMYLNADQFKAIYPDKEKICDGMLVMDAVLIAAKISKYNEQLKLTHKAIMDAT